MKTRAIIGGLQKGEVEIEHHDVIGSDCSENDMDCVFLDSPDQCCNCGVIEGE